MELEASLRTEPGLVAVPGVGARADLVLFPQAWGPLWSGGQVGSGSRQTRCKCQLCSHKAV